MGNSRSKLSRDIELQTMSQTSLLVRALELSVTSAKHEIQKQRQKIINKEKHYLDIKKSFIDAMALGPPSYRYNHEKARTWALHRGINTMLELDQSKEDLRTLELQLSMLRSKLSEEKAKIEWRAAAEQKLQQSIAAI